jgi:hypothetical protein
VHQRTSISLSRSALWYARFGWRVLPCQPGAKIPAIRAWQRQATIDPEHLRSWWTAEPRRNVGVATGPESGLFVIDVDQHEVDGERTLRRLIRKLGPLPPTIGQHTGSGGRQLFFGWPDGPPLRNSVGAKGGLGKGVDTRGQGGFVLVPPSLHPCGERYRWLEGRGPHEIELGRLPDSWLERLRPGPIRRIVVPILTSAPGIRGCATIGEQARRVATAGPGTRNHTLYRCAFRLAALARDGLVDWTTARAALADAARQSGLPADEVARTLHSAHQGAFHER